MKIVRAPLSHFDPALPEVAIRADRHKVARRVWRGTADDGAEFGFEAEAPLRHGDVVAATDAARYVIRQEPEPVLVIPLDVAAEAAAAIGWIIGNLHCPMDADPGRMTAPDEPSVRQALDRLGVRYRPGTDVFEPHAGASAHGHPHSHPHAH